MEELRRRALGWPSWLIVCVLASGCHTVPVGPPPDDSVPRELVKVTLPPYVIEAPDVLLIEVLTVPPQDSTSGLAIALTPQPISGQHLVRPDGTVGLGVYGSIKLAGLNLEEAQEAVRSFIAARTKLLPEKLLVIVDVFAYNSKAYYVITDGAGYGEQAYRFPLTGNETVLDALTQIGGLPEVASKRAIWVARRNPGTAHGEQILWVNWCDITQHGNTTTNYQVLPGDRIYVKAERIFSIDRAIAKTISPIERLLGVTLLGSETVNSIAARGPGGGGGGGRNR